MQGKEGHIAVIGCRRCRKCDSACTCRALYRVDGLARVDYSKCTMCMACVKACPNKALVLID
ncbi:4Fe-4S binding protein [Methanolobus chelungpuianus]|uniref:4Fe-4S ferredoxin-type domain-containing protein n=1 Tax=Methanolobus chelungpuianus TaxID=502115 RepID=A0AAE3HA75_9EURY|nr:4Fe-4S binding protein [Methanolobus chelungpuianus]MCQ6962068.1 hypothetical protein [Methanolobus chelungpuianus]